ncbi:MAG: hypothetical protein H5T82_05525 [Demequina sp.]|nr:hypothetical protein [Demequina sp.]
MTGDEQLEWELGELAEDVAAALEAVEGETGNASSAPPQETESRSND